MAYENLAQQGDKSFALGGTRTDKQTGKRYLNPVEVEGYFKGFRKRENAESRKGFDYIFQFEGTVKNTKGETIFTGLVDIWGKTHMDKQMSTAKVGLMTKITFTGMQPQNEVKTGRKPMYLYKCVQDPQNAVAIGDSADQGDVGEEVFEETAQAEPDYGAEETSEEEVAIGEEEVLDEPPAAQAKPPKTAVAPSPDRQAKVQGLLGKKSA